jgi:hypothetical protein
LASGEYETKATSFSRQAARVAEPARFAQHRRVVVGHTDVARQAARPRIVERPGALGERDARIRPVDQQEVDLGEPEAAETRLR